MFNARLPVFLLLLTTPVIAGPPISNSRTDYSPHGIEQTLGLIAVGASQSPNIREMITNDANSFDPSVTVDKLISLRPQVWLDGEPVDVLILTHGIEWRAAWRTVRDDRSPQNVLRLTQATINWGLAWYNVIRVNERLFAFLDDDKLSEGSIQYRYTLPNGIVRESYIEDNRLSLTTTVPAPSRFITQAVLIIHATERGDSTTIRSSLTASSWLGDRAKCRAVRNLIYCAVQKRGGPLVNQFLGRIAEKAYALGRDGKRITDAVAVAVRDLKAGRLDRIAGRWRR